MSEVEVVVHWCLCSRSIGWHARHVVGVARVEHEQPKKKSHKKNGCALERKVDSFDGGTTVPCTPRTRRYHLPAWSGCMLSHWSKDAMGRGQRKKGSHPDPARESRNVA